MEYPSVRSLFQKRNERIDWRKLAAVDVERIAREVDVDAIQENILNITYCNVEQELGYQGLDGNVIKLFRLAQLTIEYLLHSQEFLQQCLDEKDKKIESFNDQLNLSLSECNGIKDELTKRNGSYKSVKKELQKAKKLVGDYQLMVRVGATGLHRCTSCTKSFVSEYYLRSHLERRHPEEIKRIPLQNVQSPNHTNIQDENFHDELNEIKTRLKATEEELKREQKNVHQLNMKESERSQQLLQILQKHELQKSEEQEQIKAEMEGYKDMMLKELKETHRENEELQKNVLNLQTSTENWKKSALGNLQDDDGSNIQYQDLNTKIQELTQQLKLTEKENEQLKKSTNKLKAATRDSAEKDKKYADLLTKVGRMEVHFRTQFDSLTTKYENDLGEAKVLFNEYVAKVNEDNLHRSTMNQHDETDSPKLNQSKTPEPANIEADSASLYVSSNISIKNSYRVSQKVASTNGDWNDLFSFRALLRPIEMFQKPLYVYTCGESPYWRQYISLSNQPPSPNYKKESIFYGSDTKFIGSIKLFVLDIGSGTVIRSMVSKREYVEGWKEKGTYFYAMKPGLSTSSPFNKSGTFSDVFKSVSDDEVSLSSLTGTDVVKDLVQSIKTSRENLVDPDEKIQPIMESDSDSEDDDDEESIQVKHKISKEENEMLHGTTSSSFLGMTIPEKGEFYPFPNNSLAVARYNHTSQMINAQRDEILKILEDNLNNRGVDVDEAQMLSSMFDSKIKHHEKEMKSIEKKYPGFNATRKRLFDSLDDYAVKELAKKRKGKKRGFKSVETVVKAAVRFRDDIMKQPPVVKTNFLSTSFDADDSYNRITSTPDEYQTKVTDQSLDSNVDFEESESSEWNSEEIKNKQVSQTPVNRITSETNDNKNATPVVVFSTRDNDVDEENLYKRPLPTMQPSPVVNTGQREFEDSDSSSEWDSEDLSGKRVQDIPDATLADSFDQYEEPYNPKLRSPKGENVKELTASLEHALNTRNPAKKLAGAVDLHNM